MSETPKTNKKILVVGINFAPELTGIGKYTGEMVSWLAENDYYCTMVTGFPYYPEWKIDEVFDSGRYSREIYQDGKVNVYRCPLYVPSIPNGAKRIIHEASFFISAFLCLCYLLFKPKNDYVFCVAPPFHLGFLGLFYRFFKGGKMIYHIQDLQIEAARDLKLIKSKKLVSALFRCEREILKRTDKVSSISSGMIKKIKQKTVKNVLFFPNWVDTDKFKPLFDDASRRKYGFTEQDKIILYSGSIGEKQGLDSILHVARELTAERDLKFLICGSGPYKTKLQELADEMRLPNVKFLPLQPIETFNEFFNIADVHLVLQKSDAADLVMPSKLTTILAVGGLAVVTSNPGTSLYDEVKQHEMGVLINSEDREALTKAIRAAARGQIVSQKIRRNARRYAESYLTDRKILSEVFSKLSRAAD